MIDAGSSGTRIHVYRWPQRAAPLVYSSSLQISELALDTTRSETPEGHGLSSFADAPHKAGESLKPLLRYILRDTELSQIPERIASIPIYLKATAGMRVLPSSVVTAIMSSVRATLAASGFLFEPLNARVISGEEEGVFGWLGINFLMGTLDGSLNETIGCMDMGGASTQLTVAPHEEVLSSFFPLYVHHSFLPLYTHSLLYFGLNEFHKRCVAARD